MPWPQRDVVDSLDFPFKPIRPPAGSGPMDIPPMDLKLSTSAWRGRQVPREDLVTSSKRKMKKAWIFSGFGGTGFARAFPLRGAYCWHMRLEPIAGRFRFLHPGEWGCLHAPCGCTASHGGMLVRPSVQRLRRHGSASSPHRSGTGPAPRGQGSHHGVPWWEGMVTALR